MLSGTHTLTTTLLSLGVPASIFGGLGLSWLCRSRLSRYVLRAAGCYFFVAFCLFFVFAKTCNGHPFIGYANCAAFLDGVARFAGAFNAVAMYAYVILGGPIVVLAAIAEWRLRRRTRNAP